MPKGPRGEKRPGDVIGAAIMVARIAMGEIEDNATAPSPKSAKAEAASKGGRARTVAVGPARRSEIARNAAAKRWHKVEPAKD